MPVPRVWQQVLGPEPELELVRASRQPVLVEELAQVMLPKRIAQLDLKAFRVARESDWQQAPPLAKELRHRPDPTPTSFILPAQPHQRKCLLPQLGLGPPPLRASPGS